MGDTDDGAPTLEARAVALARTAWPADVLADGALAGPESPGNGLTDDCDEWSTKLVRVGKRATLHDGDSEDLEEISAAYLERERRRGRAVGGDTVFGANLP